MSVFSFDDIYKRAHRPEAVDYLTVGSPRFVFII